MLCILTSSPGLSHLPPPSSQQTKTQITTNYLGLVFVGIILRKKQQLCPAKSQSKHQTVRVTNVKCQNCLDLWLLFMYLMSLSFCLMLGWGFGGKQNNNNPSLFPALTSIFVWWWWEVGARPGSSQDPASTYLVVVLSHKDVLTHISPSHFKVSSALSRNFTFWPTSSPSVRRNLRYS